MRLRRGSIENSSEGAVNRSLDLLVETELTIIAQVYLKIEHCLFSPFPLEQVTEVRSRTACPMWGVAQAEPSQCPVSPCRQYRRGGSRVRLEEGRAAIAGKLAGEVHGVPLLKRDSGPQGQRDALPRGQ